ncbi:hypothetical protein [Sinimarinibacterium sp. NLF-5-8]|uniref:hypothetical protein n=1 Tax=Sinimarinibacterium sp. NLF-5-8 TaxID=2698684 RepID=UPI00137C3BBF|nr:hypothetical protein [Sinimarinibacterium sp. NLF-5-8]QHS09815.1 hypothetical protein GT972_06350 [Sinimarinibacterium sp. NLF-5-8]
MTSRFVFCMKWGTRYGPEYVNGLYRSVMRHTPKPPRFVCFTDNSDGFDAGIEVFPLPLQDIPGTEDLRWRKLGVFQSDLFGLKGRAIFLDLDTVVTGDLTPLFEYDKPFAVLHEQTLFPDARLKMLRRRLFKPLRYRWAQRECNTSVFAFNIGECGFILDRYLTNPLHFNTQYRREQEFVARELALRNMLHYWPASWCVSFLENCLQPGEHGRMGKRHLPADARVVVFVSGMDMEWAQANSSKISRTPADLAWLAEYWNG